MLEYYYKERIEFKEFCEKKISIAETKIIIDKLFRHFKLRNVNLFWTSGRNRSKGGSRLILNRDDLSVHLVCHEIAHVFQVQKIGILGHNKKHMKITSRMQNYCKKHNYWQEEINRRLTIKPKTQPTKQELHIKKLDKRKSDLKRYEKKLQFYTRLYSTKIRSANRSISALEKRVKRHIFSGVIDEDLEPKPL